MEWFGSVESIERLKQEYLNYLRKWKDDTDLMAEINGQYEELLARFGVELNQKIEAETLNEVISFNMKIEIIGQWIWCFDSYEYHAQLKELGFWYSASKKAWVYSGQAKKKIRSHNKIADVRRKWGCEVVKDKEEA